jgi:hypothetical protein
LNSPDVGTTSTGFFPYPGYYSGLTMAGTLAQITGTTTSTATAYTGLNLENSSQTNNTYSPFISFSRLSDSGAYSIPYATIGAERTGQGADSNWSAGDLVFGTEQIGVNGVAERMRITNAGYVGIGSTGPIASLDLSQKTDAVALPVGLTSNRPTGVNGMIRYNQSLPGLEAYVNGVWSTVQSSGTTSGILGVANGGTGTGTTFTQGSVVFAGASGIYTQNNANFFWDNTNSRLGIGTAAPSYTLDVNGAGRFTGTIYLPTAAGTNYIGAGTGDGALYNTYNFALKGWWGMALKGYDDVVHGVYDFRTGNLTTDGVVYMKGTGNNYFAGNVGIGTTGPNAPLEIMRSSSLSDGLPSTSGTAQNGIVTRISASGYGSVLDIGMQGATTGKQWIQATNSGNLAQTYSLLLNPNGGNVGIGTTGPSALFDVHSAANTNFIVYNGGSNHTVLSSVNDANNAWEPMDFDSTGFTFGGGTIGVTINSTGVGIGTTGPGYPLVVQTGTAVGANDELVVSPTSTVLGSGSGILFGATFNSTWGGGDVGTRYSGAIRYLPNNSNIYIAGAARNHRLGFFTVGFNGSGDTPVEQMSIQSNGNVGIGTTAPGAKLDVAGTVAINSNRLYLATNGDANHYIEMNNSILTNVTRIHELGSIFLDTSAVGIGVTSPQAKLNLLGANSDSTADLMFTYDSSGNYRNGIANTFYGGVPASNHMDFLVSGGATTGSVNVMTLTGAGNVGIGTTAPNGHLDVMNTVANGGQPNDGIVLSQLNGDNTNSIQTYIDGHWSDRATYASGCCNPLYLNKDVGDVQLANTLYAIHSGYVGIGTTGASRILHLYTSATAGSDVGMRIQNAGTGGAFWDMVVGNTGGGNPAGFTLWNGSVNAFAINSSGYVGIGTTGPGGDIDRFRGHYFRRVQIGPRHDQLLQNRA